VHFLQAALAMNWRRWAIKVLAHDGWAAKPGTLEAVDRVLRQLQAQGYRFVTVSELLALGQADMSSAAGR
jgi:peptidoglycan/xylan/chitin deacetylase (PgdA/CDA1 family)